MKVPVLLFSSLLLLAGCNQAPPESSASTATAPATAAPAAAARPDSTMAATTAPAADGVAATTPAAPALRAAATVKLAFAFRPAPDPDDPGHPKTSAHLVLQGDKPQDIDLGKFAGKPDVVDAEKARQAGFPNGMLLGFRSYHAASGTSYDLAVLNADGRLRIVRRRVEETAAEPGVFETSREVPLPANTMAVAAPPTKK